MVKQNDRKRVPADTTDISERLTFLNDKNIDGELYAFLQSISTTDYNFNGKCYESYVLKKDIPKQNIICSILGIKSPKTLRTHLGYLIERGYVIKLDNGDYILPNQEEFYMLIPLETLRYLVDNCKEHVVKIYVYLGTKFQQALATGRNYEFSLEELGTCIGLKIKNNSRGYEIINHALELLDNSELIKYCSYFDGQMQKKKLLSFSFQYKKPEG